MFCMCQMGYAQQWEISGVKYEVLGWDDHATITGHTFDTEKTNVIFIKDELTDSKGKTYKVEAIGEGVFFKLENLQFFYGGKNLRKIGGGAFYMSGIREIDFPNVEEIGESSFDNCRSLVRANLPKVPAIPDRAFISCRNLSEINMPRVKAIGTQGLQSTSIVHADFPELETIDEYGMADCSKLVSFNAPKLVSIDRQGMYRCSALKSFELPASFREMGPAAMSMCTSLLNLTFNTPEPPEMGKDALRENYNYFDIHVPAQSCKAYEDALYGVAYPHRYTVRPKADYTLSVSTSDNALGKCLGGGTFASGTEVEIAAIARGAGIFRQWSDGNKENPRTVKLYENMNLTAQFEEAIPLNPPTEGGMHMVINLVDDCKLELPNDEVAQVYILDEGVSKAPESAAATPEEEGSANALRLNFVGENQPIEREHLLVNSSLTYCEDGDEVHFEVNNGMVTYPLSTLRSFSLFQGTPSVQLTATENPLEPGCFYVPFYSGLEEYELPEGTTAYKAILDSEGAVVLDSISTSVIPQREAVVLLSDKPDVQLFTSNVGAPTEQDNLLRGFDAATTVPAPGIYYGLLMVDGKLGFQKLNAGDTLLPNIAYVRDQEVADIVFSGNTTSINTTAAADDQSPRYDLSGRRVNAGYKGLVVTMGRLVLQK